MGGLWVDYDLMSTIPGLHVLGEANFSDHGANRLGASALMQGLADGYYIIPCSVARYLAGTPLAAVTAEHEAFADAAAGVQASNACWPSEARERARFTGTGRAALERCRRPRAGSPSRTPWRRSPARRFWQNVAVGISGT
jgi:succinate dehydrogenase / fumarate reductase flavoprotein subunit